MGRQAINGESYFTTTQYPTFLWQEFPFYTTFDTLSTGVQQAIKLARDYGLKRYGDRDEILCLNLDRVNFPNCINIRYSMSAVWASYTTKICAVIVEVFSQQGRFVCQKDFLYELQSFCKKRDILLIVLENSKSFTTCGELAFYRHYKLSPQILITYDANMALLFYRDDIAKEIPNYLLLPQTFEWGQDEYLQIQGMGYYFQMYLARIRNVTAVYHLGFVFMFTTKQKPLTIVKKCLAQGIELTNLGNGLGLILSPQSTKETLDNTIRILNAIIAES